ncbi:MAG: histidinol dehydrogenase [SAR202 cluster bacterium]|nr:histidinol dehydrogenase [Chloroflexota bacterium]MQG59380.1 histidinol dehydrogenase [SAR202 cluster bacterium]MQG67937.1 histidinol dehydrogenase [SAR202 cluster bacterium]HAL46466.1 histidinol dehydrogenase [Dehalococcoidia bacterium]
MRIVNSLVEAKKLLSEGRGLDLVTVPPHVQATTERVFGEPLTPPEAVARILDMVRSEGDAAILRLTLEIEGVRLSAIEVPPDELDAAYESTDPRVIEALEVSAERVERFHNAAKTRAWMDFDEGYGALVVACESVGIYVPGGTAPLPSTVIMSAVPARVAGVGDIILCTPSEHDGKPNAVTLAAARIAGVDRVFGIGGAQAIAAMAYGTDAVPAVDMICGPGNLFVTLAKKMLYGEVGIDGLYGPTETLVIADDTANATLCAADLLAQAEHDALAKPVMVTTSDRLAQAVAAELAARLPRLDRASTARQAVEDQGCIVVVEDLEQAFSLANWFAPEHMCLMMADPWSWLGQVKNAGAVFIGEFSHEVLGDYVAGPSHIMPTAGTARFNSGLGVHSFVKVTPVVAFNEEATVDLARSAAAIARAEGLTGHAEAAEIRLELLDSPES